MTGKIKLEGTWLLRIVVYFVMGIAGSLLLLGVILQAMQSFVTAIVTALSLLMILLILAIVVAMKRSLATIPRIPRA